MAERVIKTFEGILSSIIENTKIENNYNLEREIENVIKIYNNRSHSALSNVSPIKFIENKLIEPKYLQIADKEEDSIKNGEFLFSVNKKIIDKKMEVFKKKFPLLSTIKLSTVRSNFSKSASSEVWTNENFFVIGHKRPYLR